MKEEGRMTSYFERRKKRIKKKRKDSKGEIRNKPKPINTKNKINK